MTLRERAQRFVELWAPRMKIGERITVKVVDKVETDDGGEAECALFPASAAPEAAGRWDFVIALAADFSGTEADLERCMRHELVHLLMEPLREPYFVSVTFPQEMQSPSVVDWETVIERIADAFGHAYSEERRVETWPLSRVVGGREFRAP